MNLTLPDELAQQVAQLGEPEAELQSSAAHYALSILGGVLALLLGLALLGFLALGLWLNPALKIKSGFVLFKMGAIGLVLLGAGVGLLRRGRSARGLRVIVCADGLARVQGDQVEMLRWEDVNRVQRAVHFKKEQITVRTPVQLTLVGCDGKTMTFDESLAGLPELRRLVEEHTLQHMLPPAREALVAGETIAFGDVAIGPQGLHAGGKTLTWDLCGAAEASKGLFIVQPTEGRRPFCKVEVSAVPNVHVLLALAEEVRQRHV